MIDDQAKEWTRRVQDFRKSKDEFFTTSHESPLAHSKGGSFKGLRYFSSDRKYEFHAKLQKYDNPEKVTLTTSNGTSQLFYRVGYFELEIDGKIASIHAYKSAARESNDLFIPFRDGTSGRESYGAARYLDIEESSDQNYVIDFNYAYNPYCAYSSDYICPLPPRENWLEVRILAGEMSYQ